LSRWRSAKLSAYYAVGLLHGNREDDVVLAGKILKNVCAVQHTDREEETYGTLVGNQSLTDVAFPTTIQ
jgi:hypothetical protein